MSNRLLTRFANALILLLMSPSLVFAWTTGLKEAADAVALGVASAEQKMMVFVHNKEINLLAQEGKISEFAYASCQDDFFRLNERFANQAVRDAGFDPSISGQKFNPGTDTDVNVLGKGGKKVTLEDIKRIDANYQKNVKQYFKNQGLEPPRGTINTETDFMPHPAHTDPDEFQKIVRYVNQRGGTAYTDPKAASAQAKLGGTKPIAIDEASSFSSAMKDMADAKVAKANQLRQEANTIRRSDPGRAEYLEAQARQYDYQASKYHERIDKLDDHLRKQYGLPEKQGRSPFDQAKEHITKAGRNPFTGKDAATIHNMHQNGLQRATDDMIDTLVDIARNNPAKAGEISKALAREVNRLPNSRVGQAIDRIDDAMRGVKGIDPAFTKNVVAEVRALKQAATASAKWTSFKESIKDLSGFNRMTKLSVVMTAGGALLMAHRGVSITLDNVKATDTLWDYFKNCYYHAVWEGTGIGPAFEQAEREEIERYMREFEAGQDPSMVKHITFTMLKTGVYMGRDAIIGLLYLPDTIWEYFTQEKGMEAYAAMQNELARVMRQMIRDRKEFDQLMARMKKMGLHEADAKPFLDCLCRGCGGSLGGLYNPGFVSDIGHGPCQCNGTLTIWKTPLPVANKEAQYSCFNEVTRMRYNEAQEIFNKWHQQMRDANAKSVEEDMKAIKQDILNRKALENEDVARNISDRFETIKDLLYPEDADYVQATVGPYLENHAVRSLEAGNVARAIDNLDRVLNKIGTRHPDQSSSIKQRKAQYEKWRENWRETKEKTFPRISTMIDKHQPHKAAWEIENLEYMMLKAPGRTLPPAINDPDFLALKQQVTNLGKRYDQTVKQAWHEATTLEKASDPRGAIPILEKVLAEWDHPQEQAKSLQGQIAHYRNRVKEAEDKIALGRKAEADGNADAAITHYTASLKIQKDEGLQAMVEKLRKIPSRPGQASQAASTGTPPGAKTTGAVPASSTSGSSPIVTGGHDQTVGAPPVIYTPTGHTLPGSGKMILDDNAGPYQWIEATEVQTTKVRSGRAAFRSTGNNHFTHRLGLIGNYPGQYRHLDLWLWFDKPGADIQIQVQVDGTWGKRWGYEAGPKYDGYGWAMEGTTVNQPVGQWVNVRLDLIDQLKIHAGQAITGLAFSSDHGDVYYDMVQLLPNGSPLALPEVRPSGKMVLEDDAGPYKWIEATQIQKEVVANGLAAFRSTGNNHFTGDLGVVGDYSNQFRTLSFWVFMIGPEADIQLQVQVDGTWGKRWGYEAGPKYDGYGWAMEGSTANLRHGVWQELKIDLIRDLKINPGQKITGLAFSSDHGDVYYDAVYLQANPNPAAKPSFQPVGKPVLEDDAGPYKWVEGTEVQDYLVFRGSKAFRSTGNNHFTADLGVAGNAAGQFQSVGFWAFFMGPEADIQLQVQVNGSWGKRWGFDAGPKYNGYGWAMEGTTANLPNGRWTWVQVDLINQLKLKAGDKITGLAFSSDNGDVIYDSVWLLPSGARPSVGTNGDAGPIGGVTPPPPIIESPGGRDYTGHDSPIAPPDSRPGSGYLRIEACVDGSDWISVDNGRLNHQHRAFDQIGTHGGCPVSHRVAGGGFLVDGLPVGLARLPMPVGMAGIGRFEVERGRGQVRMDGTNRILIDDDGQSGSDVYIIRLYPSATTTGTPPVAIVPGGRDHTAAPVQGQLIFEVGNIGGVSNGPSKTTQFTLTTPHVVTLIRNYHWNNGRGATPGSIALKGKDGSYGPWQATGSPGQGGVPNANWTVYPNITLPAGTYTVIDSDPATWSHNAESNNRGFVRVEGYPAHASQPSALPSSVDARVDSAIKELDGLLDAVKSLKGLFGK